MKKNLIKERLIEIITEGVDDPGILKCVFMAGGPGSGKSYTAKEIFGVGKDLTQSFSSRGLKIINSDTAFEKGLKDNGVNPKDLGKIERENPELWHKITVGDDSIRGRAKQLTKQQQKFYEMGRLGMIIDGTGDDYQKIIDKRTKAEKLGYDCKMVFVNTSLEVALQRNAQRDRTLPENLVTQIWKDCQNNLGKFQQAFGKDFTIVDNTTYDGSESKFKHKKTGKVITVNKPVAQQIQKTVDRFVTAPIKNPIGKQWVQNAKKLKNLNIIRK